MTVTAVPMWRMTKLARSKVLGHNIRYSRDECCNMAGVCKQLVSDLVFLHSKSGFVTRGRRADSHRVEQGAYTYQGLGWLHKSSSSGAEAILERRRTACANKL